MKYFFSLTALFLFSFIGLSQNSLIGLISENNEPLQATIFIPKLEKGAITDFDGKYVLSNIPNGTFTIVYRSIGFATVSKTITFSNSQEISQDIKMIESAVEMEEIIISTPFHKLQGENVMKVDRLSANDIKNFFLLIY